MPLQTGAGEYVYEIIDHWARIPEGWAMNDVADVGVDPKGRVYLFNRGDHPVIVLDGDGNFLHTWGDKQMFPNAHAVTIGLDDTIWLTDTFDHTVRKCTPEGEVLMTLGTSGKPAKPMSGEPFYQCTHVAVHPHTEEFFISDGYGNAKVHKYTPDGRLQYSWGEPGNEPGQFNLPHNICTDRDGYVYVADRHNARVQVFTSDGKLEHVWTGMSLPCGMHIDTTRSEQLCYIAELSSAFWASFGPYEFRQIWDRPGMGPLIKCTPEGEVLMTLGTSGKPAKPMSGEPFYQCTHVAVHPHTEEFFISDGYGNAKVHKYTPDGRLQYSWGEPGNEPGQFNLPHNICTDRDGYVYVADRHNARVQVFTSDGKLEHVWTGMSLPCGMHIDTTRSEQLCYIAELSSAFWASFGPYEFRQIWDRPGMGPRVSIYNLDGELQAKLCDQGTGEDPGQMVAPHGISVDAEQNIYVGECSWTVMGSKLDPPRQVRNVQKLVKVKQPTT